MHTYNLKRTHSLQMTEVFQLSSILKNYSAASRPAYKDGIIESYIIHAKQKEWRLNFIVLQKVKKQAKRVSKCQNHLGSYL